MKTLLTIILLTLSAAAQTGTFKMTVATDAGHGVRDTVVAVGGHSCAVSIEAQSVNCDTAGSNFTFTFDNQNIMLLQVQAAANPLKDFFAGESATARKAHVVDASLAAAGGMIYEYTFHYRVVRAGKYNEKIAVQMPDGKQITIEVSL